MTGTVDLAQHSCGLFLYLEGVLGLEVLDSESVGQMNTQDFTLRLSWKLCSVQQDAADL